MKVQVPVVRCTVCDVPYVLRFSLFMERPPEWCYQKDCKHKTGTPVGEIDVAKIETAPLIVLGSPLSEQLLEAFGTDDVAAIARGFDKGARALSGSPRTPEDETS